MTGGSRGIGRAIAERLAADGAEVVLSYAANAGAAAEVVAVITAAAAARMRWRPTSVIPVRPASSTTRPRKSPGRWTSSSTTLPSPVPA